MPIYRCLVCKQEVDADGPMQARTCWNEKCLTRCGATCVPVDPKAGPDPPSLLDAAKKALISIEAMPTWPDMSNWVCSDGTPVPTTPWIELRAAIAAEEAKAPDPELARLRGALARHREFITKYQGEIVELNCRAGAFRDALENVDRIASRGDVNIQPLLIPIRSMVEKAFAAHPKEGE